MRELVAVVVPVFGNEWSGAAQACLVRAMDMLEGFSVVFITAENEAAPEIAGTIENSIVYRFDAVNFESVEGFAQLLLSPDFYDRFGWCENLLFLEPEVWIVKNELKYWCKQGYDYIPGARGIFSLRNVDRFHSLAKKERRAVHRFISGGTGKGGDRQFWLKKAKGFWPALRSPTPVVRTYFSVGAEETPGRELPFAVCGIHPGNLKQWQDD